MIVAEVVSHFTLGNDHYRDIAMVTFRTYRQRGEHRPLPPAARGHRAQATETSLNPAFQFYDLERLQRLTRKNPLHLLIPGGEGVVIARWQREHVGGVAAELTRGYRRGSNAQFHLLNQVPLGSSEDHDGNILPWILSRPQRVSDKKLRAVDAGARRSLSWRCLCR